MLLKQKLHQQQKFCYIVQTRMSHAQAEVESDGGSVRSRRFLTAVDLDSKSPQKKRVKHVDIEHIIMGEELSDTEINLAQQLLKTQFPNLNGCSLHCFRKRKWY